MNRSQLNRERMRDSRSGRNCTPDMMNPYNLAKPRGSLAPLSANAP
jgi:hypothetical protein